MQANQSQKLKNQLTFATLKREKYTHIWIKNNDIRTLDKFVSLGLLYSYTICNKRTDRVKVYIIFNDTALGKPLK